MTVHTGALIHVFVGEPAWSRSAAGTLVARLAGTASPLNPVLLSEDQIRAEPAVLLTELSTVPMFGDRPVVWVRAGGAAVLKQIEDLLDGSIPEGAGILVAEVEALPTQSTIPGRRRDGRLSLTVEPASAPGDLVKGLASANDLHLEPAAVDALIELCGGDRGLIENELSKIAAYIGTGTDRRVAADVILAACGDVSQITAEEMVALALAGVSSQVGTALLRNRESGATAHHVAAAVVQRLFRDLRFRADRSGRPGTGTTHDDLADRARDVFDLIRDTRLSSGFEQEIAERFLLKLAISRERQS